MEGIHVTSIYFGTYFLIFFITLIFASFKRAANNEALKRNARSTKQNASIKRLQSRSPTASPKSQGAGFFKTPPGDIEIETDDRLDESKLPPIEIVNVSANNNNDDENDNEKKENNNENKDTNTKKINNPNLRNLATTPVEVLFRTTLRHSYLYNAVLLHIVAQSWYVQRVYLNENSLKIKNNNCRIYSHV